MKVKLWIKVDDPELVKSIAIDNSTAPENFKIKMRWKDGYMVVEIDSEDLGSIINVLDEILELVKLAKVSKEL